MNRWSSFECAVKVQCQVIRLLSKECHSSRNLQCKANVGAKTLGLLREQMLLLNATEGFRKVVRSGVHCLRYKLKLFTQVMGNLPLYRLIYASIYNKRRRTHWLSVHYYSW